ncbi:MAG: ornithine cyclodeaminase family protein [Clostridiales bacterium]|nr:ornithine cyclodeaminase family protein [Clostridiales bacterium]
MYPIRILNLEQTEEVLEMKTVIKDIEEVYAMKSRGAGKLFPLVFHEFEPGVADMDIKSGLLEDAGIFGLKLVSWFSGNAEKGMPLLTGTVMVFDITTGKPLGLLSAEHLTGMRTGAAGAIGAKHLARKGSENLLMVGAGHQATYQVAASLIALDNIRKVRVYDPLLSDNTVSFAARIKSVLMGSFLSKYDPGSEDYETVAKKFDVAFEAVSDIKSAVENSDVIITATPAHKPIVSNEWVREGTHFSCIGADMSGKQEIDERIFSRARVFVDDIVQAVNVGECEIPVKKGMIAKDSIIGEIGDLICGSKEGRLSERDITIFDSTGIALQDLMVANRALKSAEEKNIGSVVEL